MLTRAAAKLQALDRDLDCEALMKQSPRMLKQLAKNASLSLVSINDMADLVNALLQDKSCIPIAKMLAAKQHAIGATASPSVDIAARTPSTDCTEPAIAAGPSETASEVISLLAAATQAVRLLGCAVFARVQVGDIVRVILTPRSCARLTG